MEVEFRINGVIKSLDVAANESLLAALRREGYASVKHGCETGECGACAVLIDGTPRPACVTFAAQVGGCTLATVESLGTAGALYPIQQAFIDCGAVGCGFCAPGMLLSAYALLKSNPNPSEEEARDALSGNLCRCTGYVKPVAAVLRAAAVMQEEVVEPVVSVQVIDAIKLVTGKPAFVDDIEMRGMLHARLLTSPHAHAVIRDINVSAARALPGVHVVLTYRDIPRVPYASAASFSTESGPRDQYSLDYIARYVGDRVAAVVADTPEIAEQALHLIDVTYEVLPAVFDPRKAIDPAAARLHPETESTGIYDAAHNIAAHVHVEVGDVEGAFAGADQVVEGEYIVPQTHPAPIETRCAITYLDEDERLVVRTGAASAHTVQHILAPLIGLPTRRIRVVTPRTGGDAQQGILIEDICALLTLATRQPVRLEYLRTEEFRSGRSRPIQRVRLKTGLKRDGTIVANQMLLLASAGAYASHTPRQLGDWGLDVLPLYSCPKMRYTADAVYTNLPPSESDREGACAAVFALESHMDEIAKQVGIDALELRRRNQVKAGTVNLLAKTLDQGNGNGERGDDDAYSIAKNELSQCLQLVEEKLAWKERRGKSVTGRYRTGIGIALSMFGTAGTGASGKCGASIKLNEDGSFTLLVGMARTGGGTETIIAQLAAEALGVRLEDIVIPSTDTDALPFESDIGKFDSNSTSAVINAAQQACEQLLEAAGRLLSVEPRSLTLGDRVITALNGDTVTVAQVASYTLSAPKEQPIMAVAVENGKRLSPSFAAHGAEVEVDTETGVVRVVRAIAALDSGRVVNPLIAERQVEGGISRALGQAISEEMLYDQHGTPLTTNLSDYRIFSAPDMPRMEVYFVEYSETSDPSGQIGVFPIGNCDGLIPAIANAVADALGVRMRQIPLTPERVMRAIRTQGT